MPTLTRLISIAHMKQDTIEQVRTAVPAVAGASLTLGLAEWSQLISLLVGLATLLFIVVQMAFLLRKWYIRERAGWWAINESDTER